ncbi:MAG: DUF962 domain-containing protein [Nannocystaceae bacterium]
MDERIAAIDDFWTREFAYYLCEHRHPLNRLTHMFGIPIILGSGAAAIAVGSWRLFIVGQAIGWALQLVGHRFEGNRPALLKRPLSFFMGPLMVLIELVGFAGIRLPFAERARRAVS